MLTVRTGVGRIESSLGGKATYPGTRSKVSSLAVSRNAGVRESDGVADDPREPKARATILCRTVSARSHTNNPNQNDDADGLPWVNGRHRRPTVFQT